MNKVELLGRLTADEQVKYSQGDKPIAIGRFNLAVNRKFKREGEQDADFVSCVAFGKTAENIEKYFHKGERIVVCGRLQTGKYEKDGQTHYTTDVIVEEFDFVESKNNNATASSETTTAPVPNTDGFMNIPDSIDEELPFV